MSQLHYKLQADIWGSSDYQGYWTAGTEFVYEFTTCQGYKPLSDRTFQIWLDELGYMVYYDQSLPVEMFVSKYEGTAL